MGLRYGYGILPVPEELKLLLRKAAKVKGDRVEDKNKSETEEERKGIS